MSEDFPVNINGCGIVPIAENKFDIVEDYNDIIGHGTAVTDVLLKGTKNIESIYCIKIYNDAMEVETTTLIYALEYIFNNIKCDMILISSGVVCCDHYEDLYDVIKRLSLQGIYIISAFDNDGSISFPAAFHAVIGVGITQNKTEKPRVSTDSVLDILLPKQFYRVKWVSPSRIITSGSSFAAAYVASIVAETIIELHDKAKTYKKETLYKILANKLNLEFIEYDTKQDNTSWKKGITFVKDIHKAIVFPWNKEVHSIARFHELLPFEIVGYYDVKYNLNIGREIKDLLKTQKTIGCIQNIDTLDWNADFDTVICGHCTEISELVKKDYIKEIVQNCQKYNKRIYAFDQEILRYNENIKNLFVPGIEKKDTPKLLGGRLYNQLTPVLGIFGTSSSQGKYTLQMELRRKFLENGYAVGQITSEPTGYLFQCDGVFPFGYNVNIDTNTEESVSIINRMIWDASHNNSNDIIIVGGQSGCVPYSQNSLLQYNFRGYEFLCGTNPDAFLLCVNPHDPIDYIQRTIQYLYSFNGMPVIAIVLFPIIYEAASQMGYGYKKRNLSEDELKQVQTQIAEKINIPVYLAGKEKDLDCIYQNIISVLSEE